MNELERTKTFRPSLHVEFYYRISWLLATVGLPLLASLLSFLYGDVNDVLLVALVILGVFLVLDQLSHRRCSSEELKVRDGLRYVTACMTVGVSGFSLLVAVLCTLVAIFVTYAITAASLIDPDPTRAPRRFYSMIMWFSRHRMYQ